MKHCENPNRLRHIIDRLVKCPSIKESNVEVISDYKEAEKDYVNDGHGKDTYFDYIKSVFDAEEVQGFNDNYKNEHTTRAALLAANAVKIAVDKVLDKKAWKNAFCAIRPPGHHADAKDEGGFGFCYINNVVCGARYAQKKYGVKKICIFDWDVHHGDSTQKLTYDDAEILFISFHRSDNNTFFPGESGDLKYIGGEKALGYNLNLPWQTTWDKDHKNLSNEEYIYAFERLVAPILEEWKPDLTFVSAGFDSCDGDELGGIAVKPSCYAYITNRLSNLTAQNKVIVCLEGGYNFDSISQASECVLRALREEKDPVDSVEKGGEFTYKQMFQNAIPSYLYLNKIQFVQKEWERYWPCIKDENISKTLQDTMKKVRRISDIRQKVVGPNLQRIGHLEFEADSKEEIFIKYSRSNEKDLYNMLLASKELKDLKPLFPEVIDVNNVRVKMKNFMKSDPDHEWSTLLKVQLKPYDTLHGFTFVEANVKDTFDGETLIFCPMSEKKIWGEEDNDEARVYEGLVKFFKRSDYICNEDINLYTKIISDELAKIIDTLNKVSTENSEFIKKKFYLSELSAVLMLNHDKKKGCIK